MLTISVVSVFYASLGGIILLLSYKMFMTNKGYHAKKNGSDDHEFLSTVFLKTYQKFYRISVSSKKIVISPVYVCVKHNIKLTCRGGSRFINDMWSGREKPGTMVENDGVASTYLKKMLAKKKSIQKKNNKVFHSENL